MSRYYLAYERECDDGLLDRPGAKGWFLMMIFSGIIVLDFTNSLELV